MKSSMAHEVNLRGSDMVFDGKCSEHRDMFTAEATTGVQCADVVNEKDVR